MPEKPNILFLLSDEHSYRFLSALPPEHGGEPCRTPVLDGLIANGAWARNAYCSMPLCTPSRMSMLSGRHSHRAPVLWPDTTTLASHLGQHGYATAAVGKMHLPGACQYAGFGARPYGDFTAPSPAHQKDPLYLPGTQDHIFMPSIIDDAGLSDIPEALLQEQVVVRESLAWVREQRHQSPQQPWFLYASFCHPHFPLNAARRFFERYHPHGVTLPRVGPGSDAQKHPITAGALRASGGESQGHALADLSPAQTQRARAAYFACVDQLDEILGDFLACMDRDGLLDDTIIVYASDHGELAGEHGLWFKNTYHEASVRVPLIISLPEHRRGELPPSTIDEPVSLLDLFPTLCGLSGTPLPDGLDGIDLSSALRDAGGVPALGERLGVITEHLTPFSGPGTEYRMIRSRRYKYVACRGCEDLAFDLEADPDEQHNLLATGPGEDGAELQRLRDVLLDGFDFDAAIEAMHEQSVAYHRAYPARIRSGTANQILRGDGFLVEADQALEQPSIVSQDLRRDFADYPSQPRANRRRR